MKGGKQIDPELFRRHFSLPGAIWFATGLEQYLLSKSGGTDKLDLEAFRGGGESGNTRVLFGSDSRSACNEASKVKAQ